MGRQARVEYAGAVYHLMCRGNRQEAIFKNDVRKELVGWLVSKKTPMTQEWISSRLGMGSRANVSRAVQKIERSDVPMIIGQKKELEKMYRCVH